MRRPEHADAAVLKLAWDGNDTGRGLAMSIDGNGRRVACDPYIGAAEAVCECAANLACVGAEPLGLTNCLNFGNPEKPHIAWQLTRAVHGMSAACRAFGVPVVGGNVSLYNEGPEGPIYPTPVVGMVGELPDSAAAGSSAFQASVDGGDADMVALVGPFAPSLMGRSWPSSTARWPAGCRRSTSPWCAEALSWCVRRCGRERSEARTTSRREASPSRRRVRHPGGVGATLDLEPLIHRAEVDSRAALFGEGPGGVVVSGPRESLMELSKKAAGSGFLALGTVGESTFA